MATDVVMPQMGESLAEGTVTKWLKQVGDKIERDEPLFEISTDKVDSVIPAPAGGFLTAIKVPEGTTVDINTVVAVIDAAAPAAGGAPAAAPAPAAPAPAPAPAPEPEKAEETPGLPRDTSPLGLDVKEIVVPASVRTAAAPAPAPSSGNGAPARAAAPAGTLVSPTSGRVLTSPLVKTMAKVENVDLHAVPGTGASGRVTRNDIARYLEDRKKGGPAPQKAAASASFGLPAPSPAWLAQVLPGDRVEPMSKMREIIANHMVFSKHTSPHVYTVF